MTFDKPIHRIAIVGTGVIGASWAAQYLARGFDVVATDPAPDAEANLRKYVDEAWEQLDAIGLSPGATRDRLSFTPDMKEALAGADFVQENAPERPEFKIKLFADMDDATPADSFIASSSSGITPSVMQSKCKHPERVLVGHPFNPPHIIPLVEVVGGTKTAPQAIQRAMAFYAAIGKKPIILRKELPGHVANRLQAALYRGDALPHRAGRAERRRRGRCRELGTGAALGRDGPEPSVAPGRWRRRNQAFHGRYLDGSVAGVMKALGTPKITPELKQTITDGVLEEAGESFRANSSRRKRTSCSLPCFGCGPRPANESPVKQETHRNPIGPLFQEVRHALVSDEWYRCRAAAEDPDRDPRRRLRRGYHGPSPGAAVQTPAGRRDRPREPGQFPRDDPALVRGLFRRHSTPAIAPSRFVRSCGPRASSKPRSKASTWSAAWFS